MALFIVRRQGRTWWTIVGLTYLLLFSFAFSAMGVFGVVYITSFYPEYFSVPGKYVLFGLVGVIAALISMLVGKAVYRVFVLVSPKGFVLRHGEQEYNAFYVRRQGDMFVFDIPFLRSAENAAYARTPVGGHFLIPPETVVNMRPMF